MEARCGRPLKKQLQIRRMRNRIDHPGSKMKGLIPEKPESRPVFIAMRARMQNLGLFSMKASTENAGLRHPISGNVDPVIVKWKDQKSRKRNTCSAKAVQKPFFSTP